MSSQLSFAAARREYPDLSSDIVEHIANNRDERAVASRDMPNVVLCADRIIAAHAYILRSAGISDEICHSLVRSEET